MAPGVVSFGEGSHKASVQNVTQSILESPDSVRTVSWRCRTDLLQLAERLVQIGEQIFNGLDTD